jgi:hypothetical protein
VFHIMDLYFFVLAGCYSIGIEKSKCMEENARKGLVMIVEQISFGPHYDTATRGGT